jgi:K+-transporting ATPase c subunit
MESESRTRTRNTTGCSTENITDTAQQPRMKERVSRRKVETRNGTAATSFETAAKRVSRSGVQKTISHVRTQFQALTLFRILKVEPTTIMPR